MNKIKSLLEKEKVKSLIKKIKKNGAFLTSLILCASLFIFAITNQTSMNMATMNKLLLMKSARINETISRLAHKASALSSLALRDGIVSNDFQSIASNVVDDPSIIYVLAAPKGIVSNIYPMDDSLKHLIGRDLLREGVGFREAVMAMESSQLVLAGPFELENGKNALLVRLPLYTDKPDGTKDFWGLISVALEYPDILDSVGLDELELQGFAYEIYKIDHRNGERQIIASCEHNENIRARSEESKLNILNAEWYLRLYLMKPWYKDYYIWMLLFICVSVSFLMYKLQDMTQKAKNASKAKSEFLASMSHEIRTPMNAIIGISELLMQEDLTKKQTDYVNDIKISSTALLGIINDILDVSKIEAGKLTLVPVNFDLSGLVDNIYSMMSFAAENKKLDFILDADDSLPGFVYGDDVRIRQILVNMLGNAIKFTESGSVTLGVKYSEGVAKFIIADTGIGIKQEDIVRLYESFTQFDQFSNRGKQGTGLGLTITKSLINMMDGHIQVKSEYGKGTTFNITIPLPLGDESKADSSSDLELVSARDAKILLVEDNEINRKVATGLMKLNDITCDIATNGLEAIQKVKEKDYDIIFMDHMMPEMDGIEATVKIRAMGGKYSQGNLTIIALSANILPESRRLFVASGMDDFLAKPIDKTLLNKMLRKWVPEEKQSTGGHIADASESISESDYSPVLKSASQLSGLDVGLGLSHVGGIEDYERSLRLLSSSIPKVTDDLKQFLESGQLDRFAIDVHGMKGALAINGNASLSHMAQRLESESKKNNIEFCKNYFPKFSEKLLLFGHDIDKIFLEEKEATKTEKIEGSMDMLVEVLERLEEYIETFNREGALEELGEISDYSFGSDIDDTLEQLVSSLENFDFDLAGEIMQNIELP